MKKRIVAMLVFVLLCCFVFCTNDPAEQSDFAQPTTDAPVSGHATKPTQMPVSALPEPDIPAVWAANCDEFINLRPKPELVGSLCRIPKDAAFEILAWDGPYAYVSYNGIAGYVMSSYIYPDDDSYLDTVLKTVSATDVYTYAQMCTDISLLQEHYPGQMQWDFIGESTLGLQIPVLCIGDLNAEHQILLQGAIHGREHMTAWLLMAMAEYGLRYGNACFENVCFHIIPMINPDGVAISQSGLLNSLQKQIYTSDKGHGYTDLGMTDYAACWKANGVGVDINRNFPSGWDMLLDITIPSSERYRGTEPFSEAETRALRDYTLKYDFDATISYHCKGSVIYYEYGEESLANERSRSLAEAVRKTTGYILEASSSVEGGGYKDWCIEELKIPSLTVEVGCEAVPLRLQEIYSIFARNCRVLPTLALWVRNN